MKFTYNWIKEYVDVNIPAEELSTILTMSGLEIESLAYLGVGLANVFTVKIQKINPHPNADKLTLCDVTDGSANYEIVCGAKNMKVGDIVALAKEGAKLPNGMEIKPTKIRGVTSNGMLCSEKELGLAAESNGIMILPTETKIGVPLASVLGRDDYLFEVGLTPNRSDCLSLLGLAKEISILTGAKLKPIKFELNEANENVNSAIAVSVLNGEACNRYTARALKNVVIKESDTLIKSRLKAIGVRTINNIVDITNYVMFVYGQPLHAFDYDLIKGKKIIVKSANAGEKFVTLDEKERTLVSEDLLICDGERGVALAGVMGGINTEVSEHTKNVLLESAYFNPLAIRKTSKRLGLSSESSHRFERGVNPESVTMALDYAAALMQNSTGCSVLKGIADVHPVKHKERTIRVRYERVNKIIGTKLSNEDILGLVKKLTLAIKESDDVCATVTPSPNRHDLVEEIDIIEEIARVYGYNNIKATLPKIPAASRKKSLQESLTDSVKNLLICNGFYETINYSFYQPKYLELFSSHKKDGRINVLNPLVEEQSVMRMSLLPGLIETAKKNFNHKNSNLKLFEIGAVFSKGADGKVVESRMLSGIMSGFRELDDWSHEKNFVDFFDIKGIVELLLENIGLVGYTIKSSSSMGYLHPAVSVELYLNNDLLGVVGEIAPNILEHYDIDKKVYAFCFNFDKLCKNATDKVVFEQIPKFPYVKRDIALLVDKSVPCDDIVKEIRGFKKIVEDVTVFDFYEGEQVGKGKKSIAFRITYRDLEKTLTDEAVNEIMSALSSRLEERFSGQIRK